eukprot:TRINITY_DN2070_c0_g1_i8.p1 TRINITY_DN2070_c0_g1~~TRINITY_DN2070_c0_g1_i8.p1  ORF type:complete len:277 (-),score=56.89 TRINITY_DN2070_c0_g1_i8:746-1540(-)
MDFSKYKGEERKIRVRTTTSADTPKFLHDSESQVILTPYETKIIEHIVQKGKDRRTKTTRYKLSTTVEQPTVLEPCYTDASVIASSSNLKQVTQLFQDKSDEYNLGSEERPIAVATVDQEECKWCDEIEKKVQTVILDPGDWHFLLNVLKAIMIIYGQAGIIKMSSILGIDTVDIDKVKDFGKTLDIIKAIFYAGVLLYYERYVTETDQKTTTLSFHEWRAELRLKHPNHMLWIDLLFEFLPRKKCCMAEALSSLCCHQQIEIP